MSFPWVDPVGFLFNVGSSILGVTLGKPSGAPVIPWAEPVVTEAVPIIVPEIIKTFEPVTNWIATYGPWILAAVVGIIAIVLALYFGKDIIIVKIMEWAKEMFL